MINKREILGEVLGTFVMVLFGIGSVAVAVLFNGYQSILQIAIAWGISVMLAIYLTRHLSNAHLNPAVTLAMVISKRMPSRKLIPYVIAQVLGAFAAGWVLFLLFNPSIEAFEAANTIVRGSAESWQTAKMFGEFYSVPGGATVSMPLAIFTEGFGTFLLMLFIFGFTEGSNIGRPHDTLAPVFIGLTVTIIICLIAHLTQAGINPARDFGPRMVAYLTGWGDAAFPDDSFGFFWVYIVAPCLGSTAAAFFFCKVVDPIMKHDQPNTL